MTKKPSQTRGEAGSGAPKVGKALKEAVVVQFPGGGGGGGGPVDPITGDRPGCPVQPIGHENGTYYFLSANGEQRKLGIRDFTKVGIISLFSGDISWLCANFPCLDRDGNPVIDDFGVRGVVVYLIRACECAGQYNPAIRLRRSGVWRGTDGPVFHAGDAVFVCEDGRWVEKLKGWRVGHDVFVSTYAIGRPDFSAPAPVAEVRELRRALDLWKWSRPVDAGLIFGFLGASLLGAFPAWRVHLLISAQHGAGKSAVLDLIAAAAGDLARPLDDYSEAGVRNALAAESRIAVLDEAEGDNGAIRAVIALIRKMSGLHGARIVRGVSGGGAVQYTVSGSVVMAGISPPTLLPQDRSRILRVEMEKSTGGDPDAASRVAHAIRAAAEMSRRLRSRALINYSVFVASFDAYRAEAVMRGADGRLADMVATLLAGREVLTVEYPPDSDTVRATVDRLGDLIDVSRDEDREDSDHSRCWLHLLSHVPNYWKSGARMTIGSMIALARREPNGAGEMGMAIRTYGMRLLIEGASEHDVLLIANRHNQLNGVFHGTPWADANWAPSLRRLGPGAGSHPVTVKFGGGVFRCVRIPAGFLPDEDHPQQGSAWSHVPDPGF